MHCNFTFTSLVLAATLFAAPVFAKGDKKGMKLTPEKRKEMAEIHKKFAACLEDTAKEVKDCHKEMHEAMKKSCPDCHKHHACDHDKGDSKE